MATSIRLSPHEARVIGCLIEKEFTTPEQYPQSLNALTNACNQKSNRDPVIELTESEVQAVLDDLARMRLVASATGYGSRVTKYRHRFCNTEFSNLKLSPQETAILCELLLRGPQMPGELRSRANRMAPFRDVTELEQVLDALADRGDGPFVAKLAREPGRRESRYMHLFGGDAPPQTITETHGESRSVAVAPRRLEPAPNDDRLARLEAEVAALREEVAALRAKVQ